MHDSRSPTRQWSQIGLKYDKTYVFLISLLCKLPGMYTWHCTIDVASSPASPIFFNARERKRSGTGKLGTRLLYTSRGHIKRLLIDWRGGVAMALSTWSLPIKLQGSRCKQTRINARRAKRSVYSFNLSKTTSIYHDCNTISGNGVPQQSGSDWESSGERRIWRYYNIV